MTEMGFCGKLVGLLKNLSTDMRKKGIINGDHETSWVDSEIGVRQGCVLSPILFSILLSKFGERLCRSD